MTNDDSTETTMNAINLAVISARRNSKRAGFGWVLLDQNDTLLAYDSAISGLDICALPNAVRQFEDELCHLILTVEPGSGYCDIASLTQYLDNSSCLKVTIAYKLPHKTTDCLWQSWVDSWRGDINYADYSYIAENLAAGINKMRLCKRPWITAVSASTIENQPLPLAELRNEFGFQAYLSNLAAQNRAVLFNDAQRVIIGHLPKKNRGNELIQVFEIDKLDRARSIIDYCAERKCYSILLLCGLDQLTILAKNNLVDEIYHHIAISSSKFQEVVDPPGFLKLENWTIVSSEMVGNSIRMNIKSNEGIPKKHVPPLRNWLN